MGETFLLWVLAFTFSSLAFAAQDYYQFADASQAKRFHQLTSQLRCLVCQNQTIAESNSALASDLRNQIYGKISHGQTDIEILDYLVTRYGHYILYNPPLNSETWSLWFTPVLALLLSFAYLLYYLSVNRKRDHAVDA
jgi:cytochrome c-type biogenesis protein CcmH